MGDAEAERLGAGRLALPGDADLREEAVAWRPGLVDALVATPGVVVGARRVHEHGGTRLSRSQAGDEVARAELARRPYALLGRRRPALGDVLAREVDDGVAAGQRLGGRRPRERVPNDGAETGGAREGHHIVAAVA